MRGYLLDTSSLSLLAPDRTRGPEAGRAVRLHSSRLYLPTIAIAEIQTGLCKLQRQGAHRRAEALEHWLERLTAGFGDRVLAFDLDAARCAGELADAATAIGRHPGFADIAIAATARSKDLVVITENRRHFDHLQVEVMDLSSLA